LDLGGIIMKKKVIVKAPALSASGYGEHARFVLRSLRAKEELFDIYLHNIVWGKTSWIFEDSEERRWIDSLIGKTSSYIQQTGGQPQFDISLQVTIPNEFEKIAQKNIGITAGIEVNKISPDWIYKANEMDRIIVVSNHAKYGFDNTSYPLLDDQKNHVADLKCETPVDVVGYPVREFDPADVEFNFSTSFNFLTVALWGQRKNMTKTIENFVEQFMNDEDVGLILKTSFTSGSTYDKLHMRDVLKSILRKYPDRKCKVYLLHGRLDENEMSALYQHESVKCMLSLAHGEGFGLPLFEAACLGLPIIATDWSGQLDFLYAPQKDKKGKEKIKGLFGKIAYDLKPVQEGSVWKGVITPEALWAYPKDNSAKEKMRDVYENYQLAKNKAKKLKSHVHSAFSSDKMHDKMVESIYPESDRELYNEIDDLFSELSL
jgi:glycosyltransferase involved in cell wall biosynthesis